MTHNHLDRQRRDRGLCPSCDALWRAQDEMVDGLHCDESAVQHGQAQRRRLYPPARWRYGPLTCALGPTPRGGRTVDGRHTTMQSRRHVSHAVAAVAMGIDWMSRDELSLAIPPAYTEHIGRQLIGAVT